MHEYSMVQRGQPDKPQWKGTAALVPEVKCPPSTLNRWCMPSATHGQSWLKMLFDVDVQTSVLKASFHHEEDMCCMQYVLRIAK